MYLPASKLIKQDIGAAKTAFIQQLLTVGKELSSIPICAEVSGGV